MSCEAAVPFIKGSAARRLLSSSRAQKHYEPLALIRKQRLRIAQLEIELLRAGIPIPDEFE